MCKDIKTCERRHPKICKQMFSSGHTCQFGNGCAYSHQNLLKKQENWDLKDKVLALEKTVSEINIKMIYLESELKKNWKENAAKEKG